MAISDQRDGPPPRNGGGIVRPEIEQSWARARQRGIDPECLGVRAAEYDPEATLVTVGSKVISSSADLLVGDSASVVLADTSGTLSWRWESDPSLRRELERARIEAGFQFVEHDVGTCAVGLSMAIRRTAVVVGTEHYKRAWHPFTGATAPVVNPATRQLLGSVSICCRAQHTNRYVIAALVAFTEQLKTALRETATPRQRRLVDAHMTFRADPDAVVVTLDSEILISDDGPTGLPDRAHLWSALKESGPNTSTLTLPDGRVAAVRPVTPGRFDDGCVLIFERVSPAHWDHPLEQAEAQVIRKVLTACRGNKSAAAQRLGMSRGTLYDRLRRYGLDNDRN